jgi:hypothetical protein
MSSAYILFCDELVVGTLQRIHRFLKRSNGYNRNLVASFSSFLQYILLIDVTSLHIRRTKEDVYASIRGGFLVSLSAATTALLCELFIICSSNVPYWASVSVPRT